MSWVLSKPLLAGLAAVAAIMGSTSTALAQTSASPFTAGTRYDAMRRVVGTIAPDPDGSGPLRYSAVRNTYDAAGRLIKVEEGELLDWQVETVAPSAWPNFTILRITDTVYGDPMGRKTRETVSGGGTAYALTQFNYDSRGRLQCTAVRMTPASFGAAPADACTVTPGMADPDRVTRNVYDVANQVLKEQRAVGTPLVQDYVTNTYDADGKRSSVTDANGNIARLDYDWFNRLYKWTFPSATTTGQVNSADYEQYGYDEDDNRTSLRRRDGRTLTFGYDALNRMTSKLVPDGCAPIQNGACPPASATRDVYYGYDLRGLQLYARFDSAGGTDGVATVYDGFGSVKSSTTSMAGTSRAVLGNFDADGNRVQLSTAGGGIWTFAYDGLDRLSALYEGVGTSNVMSSWTYNTRGLRASVAERYGSGAAWSYDAIGRPAGQTDTFGGGTGNVARTYTSNPAGQITVETRNNDSYAFTGSVNVARAYTRNGLNQYTSAGSATFGYDANGNLISDGTRTYGYDAENRLLTASNGTSLSYDPLGRLYQVTGPSGTRQFLYDGDQLVSEYDGGGALTDRYVHGSGDDDPVVWYKAGTAYPLWFHSDVRGSIVATATGTSGGLVAINGYDEYGIPNAGNTGRFQYTGQAWIADLGMYHYKARVYSPTLGRFMQIDPIGYDDEINLYSYVANDPVNKRDPTGLAGDDDFKKLKQAETQLNNTSSALTKASEALGKANTVTQAAEATKDIVVVASKIAVDSVKVAGAAAADSVTVTGNAVVKAANAIEKWLGGRPTVRSHNGNTRVISPDGKRQFRHETREKTGSVRPHMHLDQRDARGNMRAAPGTPDHIFPQGQKSDEQ